MVLIMEFLSGGELFDRITDDSFKMTEEEARNYMRLEYEQNRMEQNYGRTDRQTDGRTDIQALKSIHNQYIIAS